MKIVHIVLSGPVTDGWNYQDNLITKYHKRLGHDVTLITSDLIWNSKGTRTRVQTSDYINEDGVRMIRLREKHDDPKKKLARYPGLYGLLETLEPDILFVHACQSLSVGCVVKYLKKHKNVTVYVDNHADFSNSATSFISKNILHKVIWRHYAKKIEPYTKKFYGVLPARVDFLRELYGLPAEKTELLVMGADNDYVDSMGEESAEIRKEYAPGGEILLMTGGKIDRAKKQTLDLMKAVHELNLPNVKLLVFGSVEDFLKEEFESLCGENIIYIGWLAPKDTYKYIAASDLVIYPGRHSVLWEQTVGQRIPMVCKSWEGTHHVDIGGNVVFLYEDGTEYIKKILFDILQTDGKLDAMKKAAESDRAKEFLYLEIAKKSIEQE